MFRRLNNFSLECGDLCSLDVLDQEIAEDLEAELEQFREIAGGLGNMVGAPEQ